ncbi:MAG TPA: flagellar basal-body MS-ring/collar protein FliF [Lacisediminihabitans sp.]|uniref:flagellar basal-body MS-ring/collar protein FliF n=1 Tax=Lacisediminihabitans sp. TaxID=2787631 RepID=UPI002ED9C0D7
MPRQIGSILRRLGAGIREFTVAQRTVAIIGLAVLVLGTVALVSWMARPSYSPLFSGVSAADANSIVEQLRTDGVPYQLGDGGATILVPEKDVYDERLKSAAAGLPSSSTGGYSLLDKMGVTASEFQQSVTYKRAIEGELASTIEAMKGVKTAAVQLAIPKDTVFVETKTDPTASVFVDAQNGVTLDDDQVQAIVHLTSASVDGMKAEDVAVIDSKGIVLSAAGADPSGGADKQSSEYETRVRTAVQSMLDKVAGPGNATVVVAADLSGESGQKTEETYSTPTDAPAINESLKSEVSGTGGADSSTGVLGPDNIAVPSDAATDGASTSQEVVKNNAVNKTTQSTTIPAGEINRQTVSVALNSAVAGDLNVTNIERLVGAAAGIDTTRGDQLSVQVVPFNRAGALNAAKELAAAQSAANADRIASIVRTGIFVLATLILLLVPLIVFARRARRGTEETLEDTESTELAELRAMLNGQTVPMALPEPPAPQPMVYTQLVPENGDADRQRAEIDALATKDPKRTAEFLRGLMDERQSV